MPLRGEHMDRLHAALASAFDLSGLERMFRFEFDRDLATILPLRDRNLSEIIYAVVLWAVEDEQVGPQRLLAAARAQNADNPELALLAEEWAGIVFNLRPDCPYPGMVPFREEDRAHFFGRDKEIAEAVQLLRLHPFLAVIGSSGSGKSSLVFAGILPALRRASHFGRDRLAVKTLRPGAAPLEALASALEADANEPDLVRAATAAAAEAPLLLVIDQYEELFTTSEQGQRAAFQAVLSLLSAVSGLLIVLTMRADFYPDLMNSPLWDVVRAHRLEVTSLRGGGLREAIVKPAEAAGVTVEPALVERLLADASDEPGVLPFIQEMLVLLWDRLAARRLSLAAYEGITQEAGGLSGLQVAMARRADQTVNALTEAEQAIARRIFLRLVQFGEGRPDTRRQQAAVDLQAAADPPGEFATVLRHLADHRLLTMSGQESGTDAKVDIAHEALLSGWPALRSWIAQRREAEQVRRRLEAKAAEWVRLGGGEGGRLDEAELPEAERWLASPDATELGAGEALRKLVQRSREFVADEARAREEARRRELLQAQERAAAEERARSAAASAAALRKRALWLAAALAAALLMAVAAGYLFNDARIARDQETVAKQDALVQKEAAEVARATADGARFVAEIERNTAQQREVEAVAARAEADDLRVDAERAAQDEAEQRRRAEQQERLAFASQLAADAQLQAQVEPTRTLLLATEAMSITWALEGARPTGVEGALRLGLQLLAAEPFSTATGIAGTTSLAFVPQTGRVFAVSGASDAALWRTDTLAGPAVLVSGTVPAGSAAVVDPAGSWVAVSAPLASHAEMRRKIVASTIYGKGAVLGDSATEATPLREFPYQAYVTLMAASPDSRWLSTISADGSLALWDLAGDDTMPAAVRSSGPGPTALAVSTSGRHIAVASASNFIRAYAVQGDVQGDVQGASEAQILFGHEGRVNALAFSPQGALLASAGGDGAVRLWDLAGGGDRLLQGGLPAMTAVAFSADGARLAGGAADGSVRIWSVTDRAAAPLLLHAGEPQPSGGDPAIAAVAYSPDGRWLAAITRAGDLFTWRERIEDLMSAACAAARRNLTAQEWALYLSDQPYRKTCQDIPFGLPERPLQNSQVVEAFLSAGRELNGNGWRLLERAGLGSLIFRPGAVYGGPSPAQMGGLTLEEQEVIARRLRLTQAPAGARDAPLAQDPNLLTVPAAPPPAYQVPLTASVSLVQRSALTFWNRYGGLVSAAAHEIGLPPETALAVMSVESAAPPVADGRLPIRFEVHVFHDAWGRSNARLFAEHFAFDVETPWQGHRWRPSLDAEWREVHGDQEAEWAAFQFARTLDPTAAARSISMGSAQLMGFNANRAGYDNPEDMLAVLTNSEVGGFADLLLLFDTVRADPLMLESLRRGDYRSFATSYNGPGQAERYADLIAQAEDALRAVLPQSRQAVDSPFRAGEVLLAQSAVHLTAGPDGGDPLGALLPGTALVLLDGPVEAGDANFWRVAGVTDAGYAAGWMPEQDAAAVPLLVRPPKLAGTAIPDPGSSSFLGVPFSGGYPVTQLFGENGQFYQQFGMQGHNGLDLALPYGTEVLATADGVVAQVGDGETTMYGVYVRIVHLWGESLYAQLDSALVSPGQPVERGQAIALSGNSGFSSGPHLHFGLRVSPFNRQDEWGGFADPLLYLPPDRIALPIARASAPRQEQAPSAAPTADAAPAADATTVAPTAGAAQPEDATPGAGGLQPLLQGAAFHERCREGLARGEAEQVLSDCEVAVGREPANSAFRLSLAVAYAQVGKYASAVRHLSFAFEHANGGDSRPYPEWLRALEDGSNPFDEAVVAELLKEE